MVLPNLVNAGMETMVARLAARLAARGHDVGVTCILRDLGPLAPRLAEQGVRVSLVPTTGVVTYALPRVLSAHLATHAPDIVHVHSGAWIKGAVAGRQARRPHTIFTAHGLLDPEPWTERWCNRIGAVFTDRIVAVSEHLRAHLIAQGLPAGRIEVIINGIDTDTFRPGPPGGKIRARYGMAPSTLLVGTVARLEGVKNQAMLIDAVAIARAAGTDCEAVLVGSGALQGALEQQARANGIADKVHFWGLEADVAPLYRDFDVFALTSTIEGTSISMMEAMASGACCAATAVGGNVDLLDGGTCGELVPTRQPEELARTLARLAQDPARRRALGTRARARIEFRFSERAMVDAYEALYRRCPATRQLERTA